MLIQRVRNEAQIPQGTDVTWFTCVGLIVVCVCAQLCVLLRYVYVASLQAQVRVQGKHFGERYGTDASEQRAEAAPGFPLPSLRRFASGAFQRDFENAARKNFPWSDTTLIPFYRDLSAKSSRLSLLAIPGFSTTSEPLLAGFTLTRAADGARIYGPPTVYRAADHAKLAQRAAYYNALHAAWPQVRFHVFPALPVADWFVVSNSCEIGSRECLAGDRYVREFRGRLDPAINYAWAAEGCSAPEAISCYYRTDHHWNFPGAYRAYCQLWSILHAQNPALGPRWEPRRWIELPDLTFRGTLACRAGYCDVAGDKIVDGVFDLPELKVRIYGFEQRQRNAKERYQAGQYAHEKFANHYAGYFGTDYGLIEYTGSDAGRGGLLVISDSLDTGIESLLASHFDHAWFVDLRLYAKDVGQEFQMEDFLACRGITDVLFLGFQEWVLGLQPQGAYQ